MRQIRSIAIGAGPHQSRALSVFVSLAASRLPRNEFRYVLPVAGSIVGAAVGVILRPNTLPLDGAVLGLIVGLIGASFYFRRNPDPILWLEQRRKSIGLDRAISEAQLSFLEAAARDWERIDNALTSEAWRGQVAYHARVERIAEVAMLRVVDDVLQAGQDGPARGKLTQLANAVESVSAAMGAYERPEFDSSGAAIQVGVPAVMDLETLLRELESAA